MCLLLRLIELDLLLLGQGIVLDDLRVVLLRCNERWLLFRNKLRLNRIGHDHLLLRCMLGIESRLSLILRLDVRQAQGLVGVDLVFLR